VALLLDSGDMRLVDLAQAAGFRLADAALQQQLKEYLTATAGARSQDKRSVYIDSSDVRSRTLVASYMIPTPVWKSSYRLIFKPQGDATLEGWAIVDNTTGEDWTNVQLALVSGRPISFISKLYEPKYRIRPEAELPEDRAQAPVVYAGAMQEEAKQRMAPMAGLAAAAPPPPAPLRKAERSANEAVVLRDQATSSIDVSTQGRELGDLFEYRFSTPVNVKKSESAMLPFLQQSLQSRKLLIYSDRGSQHPLNAAELTNSTGKTLDGGPITIYDAGAYAGEALVETVKAGDKRLISYGVDLGTRVTTQFESSRDLIREIHATRGILTTRTAMQETLTYTVKNVDAKAKTLIVEHPARPEYKLLSLKPSETTPNAWRFEVKLAPNATEKFPVAEERLISQSISLVNQTPDFIGSFLLNKALSEAGRKQLQPIVNLKRQIADLDGQLRRAEAEATTIANDQNRIRENIGSLNRVSGQQEQVQKYARDLAASEARLATVRDRIADLRNRKSALESELNSLIEKLEF
jgi:hypothetical protein